MTPDLHTHAPHAGHTHDDHDHKDHPAAAAEPRLPPSGEGTVVLDIGDGIGALVVHTTSALAGTEIEIARLGDTKPFVHTDVRARVLPDGTVYAGVFPELQEGDYTLLHIGDNAMQDLAIRSGCVTEIDLSRG